MMGIVHFLKIVLASIVILEVVGWVILTIRFWADMPFLKALWFGLFHAISVFNNAWFLLFRDNMMGYVTDLTINITIPTLIIFGGLGYFVLLELYNFYMKGRVVRLSTHTKIVVVSSIFLILLGMFLLLSLEWSHAFGKMVWYDKIMAVWFASVNYRTAGFNSIDIGTLTDSNLFFSTFFMMTGGAPGGTAGGIKITAVVLAFIGAWIALCCKLLAMTGICHCERSEAINFLFTDFS